MTGRKSRASEPLAVELSKLGRLYTGDDTFYWFSVHVCRTEMGKDDKGEVGRFEDGDVEWSAIHRLNTGFSCLSLYTSEDEAWTAMLQFLGRCREIAVGKGYVPAGETVECQNEFSEWYAYADFDIQGRQVRLYGRLHGVNRF